VSTVSQLMVFMGGVFASANFYCLKTEASRSCSEFMN